MYLPRQVVLNELPRFAPFGELAAESLSRLLELLSVDHGSGPSTYAKAADQAMDGVRHTVGRHYRIAAAMVRLVQQGRGLASGQLRSGLAVASRPGARIGCSN
ncbi:hypothetical protein GCM10017556_24460 [Micromonospora sagamiensis]|nr:hypothetical protein GCM10017556_24460 [Micromonospora sagamiensis]